MADNIVRFLGTAWDAASTAGEIIRSSWQQPQTIAYKGAIDLVTSDKECEEKIVATIRRDFPDHSILAEEATQIEGAQREYCWIVDPLDGTTNFTHGYPQSEIARAHVDCIPTG